MFVIDTLVGLTRSSEWNVKNAAAIFPKICKMGIKIQIFADL